jgi:hypothetical protein
MSGPRGLHLSGTQAIASVLATLTGAVAASYLGVAGTLVGAAVGSVASTMGTEVYRHYLLRSQERLRSAGEVLHRSAVHSGAGRTASQSVGAARTMPGSRHGALQDTANQDTVRQDTVRQDTVRQDTAQPPNGHRDMAQEDTASWHRQQTAAAHEAETQVIPHQVARWRSGSGDGPATETLRGTTASDRASGDLAEGPSPSGGSGGNGGWWRGISRRRWLTYGGVALGFFLVVIAGITVFELSVGKPLESAVWGKPATGTSVGNAVGGQSSPQKGTNTPSARPTGSSTPAQTRTPAQTPAPSASAPSASAGSSASATPSATRPSPSATSPAASTPGRALSSPAPAPATPTP